ncbi:LysR family transcriptional regulator [Rhodococcus sp. 05-2254-5]|uniref:LysR family transcriptional regulator n=1 Tax=Nocardiaceae TaxID=85025 RepID=UPI000564CB99|nr:MULTISPECIES: LysR family transcriptional regulator [Rhodococcus]OZC87991.1 LysR family transcriptional regulator [Rhodococcus sp. 06-418-1B]OZE32097.1 LysR family transcriptional regulator [Rhodococcus sp. 05-2254-5]OZE59520.1 LysR family transcriptional regulator [Rhodococcus sp. 05-2254-1]OZE85923.1 LysR family transcriptional regulator [Rhodococcus sp. 15-649-1-2]
MDARKLKYFLAIVDEGSINRASEVLLIAQPTLSQAIAGLERELGVPLFHRIGRRLVLSDAGETLVGPARVVLRDLDDAEAAVHGLKGLRGGRLDLITMPSPGIEPLTTILTAFGRLFPAVTVNAQAAFTPEEVLRAVRTGVSEIGILGSPQAVQAPDLRVVTFKSQPLLLLSSPDADLPDRPEIQRSELSGLRLIASQQGSLMRSLVDDILASGIPATIAAEVAHRTSILPMVLSGFGHAVTPSAWAASAEKAGVRVRRIVPESYLHVAAVCRLTHMTPPARVLMDEAQKYAGEVPN